MKIYISPYPGGINHELSLRSLSVEQDHTCFLTSLCAFLFTITGFCKQNPNQCHLRNFDEHKSFSPSLGSTFYSRMPNYDIVITITYRWLRAILLYVPIRCIGTYKSIALNHRYVSDISMGESSTVVSAYTFYRHLQKNCSHPSICGCCQSFPLPFWSTVHIYLCYC